MAFISKRAFTKAYKLALADNKIPASTNFVTYKYGDDFLAEYGIYWPTLDKSAALRVATDGHVILSHATITARTSHFVTSIKDWQPE